MQRGQRTVTESLPIPSAAKTDPNSVELIRVWMTESNQFFAINAQIWDDPAFWGGALVDLAKNVSRAFEHNYDITFEDALALVKRAFDAEIENPTD